MEHSSKIKSLIKDKKFEEAHTIASGDTFPESMRAEISKLHGDELLKTKDYDSALQQFINTIGFINPSYVIQKFIDVQFLPFLVKYLETLIENQSRSSKLESVDLKDYTALLLNCYVKMKMHKKIDDLTQNIDKDTTFDVGTVIEICRQQEETLEQAIFLAE